VDIWKSPRTQQRRDKVAVRTTCIKNIKFKIIKIRTGCQYVGYLYYSENLFGPHKTFNRAAQNLQPGRGLDILGIDLSGTLKNWVIGFVFSITARSAPALAVAFFRLLEPLSQVRFDILKLMQVSLP